MRNLETLSLSCKKFFDCQIVCNEPYGLSREEDQNGRVKKYGYYGNVEKKDPVTGTMKYLGHIDSYYNCNQTCVNALRIDIPLAEQCLAFERLGVERKRVAALAMSPFKETKLSAALFRLDVENSSSQTDAATAKEKCEIFHECAGVYASSDYTKFYLATENSYMASRKRIEATDTEYGAFYKLERVKTPNSLVTPPQLGIPSNAEIKAEQQRHWGTPTNQTPDLITAPSLQNPIFVPTPTGWSTLSNSSLGNLSSPSSDPEAYLPLCKTTDQYLTGDDVKVVTKCKGLAQKKSLTNPLLNYCTDPATMAFMQTYCAMSCEKLKTPCRGKPTT
jgi:hypothetical protein